jgi:hypothetical protein
VKKWANFSNNQFLIKQIFNVFIYLFFSSKLVFVLEAFDKLRRENIEVKEESLGVVIHFICHFSHGFESLLARI